jgi:succinate-acetate transporter protein
MGESSIDARSFFIIFFILAVGFSLACVGIFKDNMAIG